ncbi:hypothetical protein PM082_000308 [Marasmius tenuissimus]|nr:hypothetical protein PM082_000308 [Marasmius tenuissimus]
MAPRAAFVTAVSTILSLLSFIPTTLAADCKTATVGSPFSTCWDIATAAMISVDQLNQYNPGLDCGALQLGQKLCVSAGDLPSTGPKPNPDGSCATYTVIKDDTCAIIGSKNGITAAQIEQFNVNAALVSKSIKSSVSPPEPLHLSQGLNPNLQCGPESPSRGDCPLKACCSAFGFCGITSEFCETAPNGEPCISNCGYATLPKCDGSQMTRKVGYYAGWAAKRTCDPVTVAQLDLSDLTHVIYAFAIIKTDGTIGFDDSADSDRLKELVTKAAKTKTKVLVAVGGWTFSEGATKDRFSVMIASSANRSKFIDSVKSFISSYKIDGIDIDFEYPAAMERQGPPEDTPNLTLFFSELKSGVGSSLVTVATPAGYWFLKGFEMDKIAKNLDFINMMSYDYHGPWDTSVEGANSTAQPQSSLEDMIDSAKLYVKAGVDLKKINIGLAWYGRTYKLQDSTCTGYGCDMTGGGTKGKCTGESGVLAGLEITDIILEGDLRPVLHKKSQTRWFTYKGDLITFDDDDTRAAKAKWAGETCFGGSMIWSIDQEIPRDFATPGPGIVVKEPLNQDLGAYWSEPVKSNDCHSYGTREWRSRLWNIPSGYDWIKACKESPVEINGVRYETPDSCEDLGFSGGVIGKWYISSSDDKHCMPHWGSLGDDGCTSFGKHRWWARLWDIPGGVDWYKMCATTPVEIDGKKYNQPNTCEDQSWYGGEIGIWIVDDDSCKGTWGDLKDNGCADTTGRREWSSKLFDIIGSWEDACNNRDATVDDEYFSKPTRCEKHITGIWGVFETQDPECGVPPCPKDKTWDFGTGGCAECSGSSRLMSAAQFAARDNLVPKFPNATVAHLPEHINATISPSHRRTTRNATKHHRLASLHSRDTVGTSLPRGLHLLEKRVKYCDAFWLPRPQPDYFPQIPAAWAGQAAEGPSAAEIASSTTAQAAFQEAWNDSFNTRTTARETGGWIYADQNNPSRIYIRRAPDDRSRPMNQLRPPPNVAAGIDLWHPERAPGRAPPAGFVLVATFHTHPMGESYGGNAAVPSTADHQNAWQRGVPGLVINRRGIVGYGPTRRAQLNAPQGYPMSNEEWSGQGGEGTRLGTWRPNDAPNQQE